MRSFVPEADGPGAVIVFVEKLFEVVGEEVGVVAFELDVFAVYDKDGVFVITLSAETDPPVKTGFGITARFVNALDAVVYFAKECGAIACFLQLFGPGFKVGVDGGAVVGGTVGVRIDA